MSEVTYLETIKISSRPGVIGGWPCIDGHRIWVALVAEVYHAGTPIDEMLDMWPSLDRAKIHAALSYYYLHQADIEAQIKEAEEKTAQLIKDNPNIFIIGKDGQ